jgi:D-glycerate 3-kinase
MWYRLRAISLSLAIGLLHNTRIIRGYSTRAVVGDLISSVTKSRRSDESLAIAAINKLASTPDEREKLKSRMLAYYLPLFDYYHQLVEGKHTKHGPLFIGISAPQGCGKTTLCSALEVLFGLCGKTCVVASIDDFYLTANEQVALAAKHPENRLLKYRGNAGSHDLRMIESFLSSVKAVDKGDTVPIIAYDKALEGGRGDRVPESMWKHVEGPVDVVIIEGWMLGFTPLSELQAQTSLDSDMKEINEQLKCYEVLHMTFDAWLILAVHNAQECIFDWRLEAEKRMRAERGVGLSDDQVDTSTN